MIKNCVNNIISFPYLLRVQTIRYFSHKWFRGLSEIKSKPEQNVSTDFYGTDAGRPWSKRKKQTKPHTLTQSHPHLVLSTSNYSYAMNNLYSVEKSGFQMYYCHHP